MLKRATPRAGPHLGTIQIAATGARGQAPERSNAVRDYVQIVATLITSAVTLTGAYLGFRFAISLEDQKDIAAERLRAVQDLYQMDAATARIEYSTSIIMRDIATMVMDIDYATVKFGSAEMDEDLALALSVEVEVLESEHEKWTQTVKDAWATATSNRSRMRPTFVRLAENYEFLVWQMENFLRVSKNPRAGYSAAIVRKTAYGIVALSEGVECMTTRLHQDFFTLAPKTDLDQRRRTVFDSQECALVALSSHMRARAKSRYRTPI